MGANLQIPAHVVHYKNAGVMNYRVVAVFQKKKGAHNMDPISSLLKASSPSAEAYLSTKQEKWPEVLRNWPP